MAVGDQSKLGVRILLGAVVMFLGGSMLLYLVPQSPVSGEVSTDTVAKVGDESISVQDIRQRLNQMEQGRPVLKQVEAYYAQVARDQIITTKEMEYEARRLGITVSDQERADRIRQYVPTAFSGGNFVGMEKYSAQVEAQYQMTVPVFEDLIRQGLLQDKFQKLVTDGISVGPNELQDGFRYKNEKVKLDYVFIKPEDLETKIAPDDAEIRAAYEKSKAKYQVPERRVARYALVDVNQIRLSIQVDDAQLKAQYQANVQQYQVPNRVHVEHILFMTVGKPDAEVEEIRKKAEDVLAQVKKGGKFEDLAKKYSEDPGSKDKGGDLGWIVHGQTVPEFENSAFSLAPGQVSDLVKSQYGFHIIKVLEKETAHTKPFEEVKESLRPTLMLNQADKLANDTADKLAAAIRQSNKLSLDDLAKQYHLSLGQTRPIAPSDPLLELANSKDAKDAIFQARQGDLSLPIRTDRGYVVIQVTSVQPAHQGTLEEVRDRVIADLKQGKSAELAKSKADDLYKRVKAGEKFDSAAKALGLEPKTSDPINREGSISGASVSGRQINTAFNLKTGDVAEPLPLGPNWFVYRIAEKTEANPADFEKDKKQLTEELLNSKRSLAYEAFQKALDNRLKQEGKVKIFPEKMKEFGAQG